jgi:hypothetical protein
MYTVAGYFVRCLETELYSLNSWKIDPAIILQDSFYS